MWYSMQDIRPYAGPPPVQLLSTISGHELPHPLPATSLRDPGEWLFETQACFLSIKALESHEPYIRKVLRRNSLPRYRLHST